MPTVGARRNAWGGRLTVVRPSRDQPPRVLAAGNVRLSCGAVRPRHVVVRNVLRKPPEQVPLVEGDQVVQALSSRRPHHSLGSRTAHDIRVVLASRSQGY
jgi:hypothetical protein